MSINSPTETRPTVLNTNECIPFIEQLNNYENSFYPTDLQASSMLFRHWIESNFFFCSSEAAVNKKGEISPSSVLSILVTTKASILDLIHGHIQEYQLNPWNPRQGKNKAFLYIASFINTGSQRSSGIFDSIRSDYQRSRLLYGSPKINGIYAISANDMGASYLRRQGFQLSNFFYLGKYPIYRVNSADATKGLWREIMADVP